jgi:Arc-like DNA binding domain
MVRKSRQLRPVMTRIPEGLRRRLEREAEQNGRSMNAEIIHRLESSFQREDTDQLFARALNALVSDVQDIKQQVEKLTAPTARHAVGPGASTSSGAHR